MAETKKTHFLEDIVQAHVEDGTYGGRVVTRFPPEPNGFPHIGHAKSICLNFGLARTFGGVCHLRMDDTNPETEEARYVEAFQRDVRWLGFEWGDKFFYASDYFGRIYEYAVELVEKGHAYVCPLSDAEIREWRGTVTEPGRASPGRDRSPAENLDMLTRMKAGEFPDGKYTLRARIDMANPNMKMRDPLLYRIRHARHYRTGDTWCIYPMYDFAHCLSDSIEGITHSICTLEFENNRELYDWLLDHVDVPRPQPRQYEFARLDLNYTVLSKRKLLQLVNEGRVSGWDDPRIPTLSGMRRRGVRPEALRAFCDAIGVAKANSTVDLSQLEHAIREDLNQAAPRLMCVSRPLEVVIETIPEGTVEEIEAPTWPHDVPKEGSRKVWFGRRILIERDDFAEVPPKGWHRLSPGAEVRLRHGYVIRCERVEKDPRTGEVTRLVCSHDPASRTGSEGAARKVKGTIHWVPADRALTCRIRLYDRLFSVEDPAAVPDGADWMATLNPESLVELEGARVEPAVRDFEAGTRFQFERLGYFWPDPEDSRPDDLVFSRIIPLRDSWAKTAAREAEATTGAAAAKPPGGKAQGKDPGKPTGKSPGKGAPGPASAKAPTPGSPKAVPPDLAAAVARLTEELGVGDEEALVLAGDPGLAAFFEAGRGQGAGERALANWLVNELRGRAGERPLASLRFGAAGLAELVVMVEDGTVSAHSAKRLLDHMVAEGGSPRALAEAKGLTQIRDRTALAALVDEVLAANPGQVDQYRAGKTGLLGFFVGAVMKKSGGRAEAAQVNSLVAERLSAG